MNLLVTGGTGFIGRALVEEALRQGVTLTVLARPGRVEFLHHLAERHPGLRVIEQRNADPSEATPSADFDALINLVGPGVDSWAANWRSNVEFVRQQAELMRRVKVRRIVHFSSVSVYGVARRLRGTLVREDDPLTPDDWYGLTKVLSERIWAGFHGETGVPVTILRPSWVIGRGSRLLDRYLLTAARSGVVVRMVPRAPLNAVYVGDVARAALLAAAATSEGVRAYNINAPEGQVFGQFAQALQREVSRRKIPVVIPEPAARMLALRFGSLRFLLSGVRIDGTRARDELGFVPGYDIHRAIREIVADGDVA